MPKMCSDYLCGVPDTHNAKKHAGDGVRSSFTEFSTTDSSEASQEFAVHGAATLLHLWFLSYIGFKFKIS